MATSIDPAPARPCSWSRWVAVGLTTAGLLALVPAGDGRADPRPTIEQVQQRTAALDLQVDQAVDQYQQAQLELSRRTDLAAAAQGRVREQQGAVDALQASVSEMVASAYRNQRPGGGLVLLATSGDAQAYLARAAVLDRLAADQAQRLSVVSAARSRLQAAQHDAETDLAAQRAVQQSVIEHRTAIEADLASQQALLDSLRADERARLQQQQAAQEAAALQQAQAAQAQAAQAQAAQAQAAQAQAAQAQAQAQAQSQQSQSQQSQSQQSQSQQSQSQQPQAQAAAAAPAPAPARASRSRTPVPVPVAPAPAPAAPPAPAAGAAATAVAAAYSALGRPYQWGAGGPGSFDCSGLTSWAWAKAGVALPRSAEAQYAAGAKVPQAAVQPGDLVYFGSPIHHVGMYIGNGLMISAPHTGDVVKIQAAFRSDFVGATRP